MGDCFDVNAEVLLDNCQLAKLDQSLDFDLEVTFVNNATLSAKKVTRKVQFFLNSLLTVIFMTLCTLQIQHRYFFILLKFYFDDLFFIRFVHLQLKDQENVSV